jgi:hypothetical protein
MKSIALWVAALAVCGFGAVTSAAEDATVSPMAVGDEKALFSLLDLERTELKEVKQAVAAGDWPSAKRAWARHLESRTKPRLLWSRRDRAELLRIDQEKFGGLGRYIKAADRVLARDFEFLGVRKQLEHQVTWLHGPIEWTHVKRTKSQDPKSTTQLVKTFPHNSPNAEKYCKIKPSRNDWQKQFPEPITTRETIDDSLHAI